MSDSVRAVLREELQLFADSTLKDIVRQSIESAVRGQPAQASRARADSSGFAASTSLPIAPFGSVPTSKIGTASSDLFGNVLDKLGGAAVHSPGRALNLFMKRTSASVLRGFRGPDEQKNYLINMRTHQLESPDNLDPRIAYTAMPPQEVSHEGTAEDEITSRTDVMKTEPQVEQGRASELLLAHTLSADLLSNRKEVDQSQHLSLHRVSAVKPGEHQSRRSDVGMIAALLDSTWFNPLTGFLITLNAILIGAETDYMARHRSESVPNAYKTTDFLFLAFFLFEIAVRILRHGQAFFTMRERHWNIFDFSMVVLQTVEAIVTTVTHLLPPGLADVSRKHVLIWRFIRMLRLLRIFRFFRILRMFSGLRVLVVSVEESLKSLAWSIIMIFIVIYTLGVCLTQIVTSYKVQQPEREEDEALEEFYGNLWLSMLSLYEAITEGIHWHELMDPLRRQISPWMALAFSFYMAFCSFAMLNVITGIFVESAIAAAREDKRHYLVNRIVDLFLHTSSTRNAEHVKKINLRAFSDHLASPEMQDFLTEVDLNEKEAIDLFGILDEGSGEVAPEAFVYGCVRLNGPTKAIDLAAFMHEFQLFTEEWHEQRDFTKKAFSKIYENLLAQAKKIGNLKESHDA